MSKKKRTPPPAIQPEPAAVPAVAKVPNPLLRFVPIVLTLVFFILSFIGILHHHPWRDEFQAWMIARDAHSLPGLYHNLKYESHPITYYLFLYALTRFTDNTFWMQLVCICISTGFIFVINRYSPFHILLKALITFGYYTFFEYSLICRSYGLGILFIVVFCALYKNRYKYYLLLAVLLGLMANVSIYTMLLSLCFGGTLFLDYLMYRKTPEVRKISVQSLLIPIGVLIIGWALAAIQIAPAHDNTTFVNYPGKVLDMARVQASFCQLFNAYYALPDLSDPHYWNTNFFGTAVPGQAYVAYEVSPLWTALTILVFSLYFIRKPLVLLLYILATAGLLGFVYYTVYMAQRYLGHLFIVLLVCMWISEYYNGMAYKDKALAWLSMIGGKAGYVLFIIVLAVNFIGGIGCYYLDHNMPFSTSYQAADYLRKNNLDKLEMGGFMDYTIAPIAALLDRKIYYPNSKSEGTYIVWGPKRSYDFKPAEITDYFHDRVAKGAKKIVMLFNFQLSVTDPATGNSKPLDDFMVAPDLHMALIHTVSNGVVADEQYYIYLVEQKK